jgi:hypothetical protein
MSEQANVNRNEVENERGGAAATGTGFGTGAPATAAGTSPNRSPRSHSGPPPALTPQEEEDAREAAFQAENTIAARQVHFDDSSSEFTSDSSESGYGSGDSSLRSVSLSSSVRDYAFENGRR